MKKEKMSIGAIVMLVSLAFGFWSGKGEAIATPETPAVEDAAKPTTLAVISNRITRLESRIVSLTARKVCECRDTSDDVSEGEELADFSDDDDATETDRVTVDCSSGQCVQTYSSQATRSRGLLRGRVFNWRPFRR